MDCSPSNTVYCVNICPVNPQEVSNPSGQQIVREKYHPYSSPYTKLSLPGTLAWLCFVDTHTQIHTDEHLRNCGMYCHKFSASTMISGTNRQCKRVLTNLKPFNNSRNGIAIGYRHFINFSVHVMK
jgi:hypothetical protein